MEHEVAVKEKNKIAAMINLITIKYSDPKVDFAVTCGAFNNF